MKFVAGFIGCGNMGGALAIAASKTVGATCIAVCDNDKTKLDTLCAEHGFIPRSAEALIADCDFVFLGLKPQIMEFAITPLVDLINQSNAVIVTMAAGIETSFFKSYLGINRPIIRIMPNTPCLLGSGMILYSCTDTVSKEDESRFCSLMSGAGLLDKIPESKIDAASAVSGCGPAFAYIFAEALADAGVECGLQRDKAILYASQMLKGSSEMLLKYGTPAQLKDNVCSPGGTTIAGVHALENAAFRSAAMNAVTSAYKRTLELKK